MAGTTCPGETELAPEQDGLVGRGILICEAHQEVELLAPVGEGAALASDREAAISLLIAGDADVGPDGGGHGASFRGRRCYGRMILRDCACFASVVQSQAFSIGRSAACAGYPA